MRCACSKIAATGLATASALLLVMAGCSSEPRADREVRRPVKTMVVSGGDNLRVRTFPGKVEASRRVELAFQVPGLLVHFPVKEGQKIAKGDQIGQLRQDRFQEQLATAQGQLDQARAALRALLAGERPEERLRREAGVRAAKARLANARTEFERSSRLLANRAVSAQAHELAQTTYRVAQEEHAAAVQLLEQGIIAREEDIEAAEALVRTRESEVVAASINLQDATLLAPYDGVIAERLVEEQQNVQAKQPVVRFQDVEEVQIIVDVPESVMVADIRQADIVQLVAELSGAPGIRFPVEIKEIGQVADPVTQTFAVRVAMQSPENFQVLPGMTATVTATYRRASVLGERILVPLSAVLQASGEEPIVWVIGPDETAARRPVKLGSLAAGEVEIVEGLTPGDRIAVAGVTFLREGMLIRDLGDALGGG